MRPSVRAHVPQKQARHLFVVVPGGASWRKDRDKRVASLQASKRTPEARARQTEINNQRWADPAQHERLAEWNRGRWADPSIKAALSQAIAGAWTPARRRAFSALRANQWANDPSYYEPTVAGIRRSKGSPEARALFSALLKARWQDPVWRQRWADGTRRRMNKPEERKKFSDLKRAWWRRNGFQFNPRLRRRFSPRRVHVRGRPYISLITGPDPFQAQREAAIPQSRKGKL